MFNFLSFSSIFFYNGYKSNLHQIPSGLPSLDSPITGFINARCVSAHIFIFEQNTR